MLRPTPGMKLRPSAPAGRPARATSVGRTGTRGTRENADGQAAHYGMGREPDLLNGRPCDLSGCAASTNPSVSFRPLRLLHTIREEAICDRSPWTSTATSARWRSRTAARCARRGRIKTSRAELELFAQSLGADDQVALEATGPALADQAPARAPRRPRRDRQHAQAAGDRRGEGEDRQGRRPDALRAARGRLFARGLRPRRGDPGAAAPARAPRRAGSPAHPGQERAARGARPAT